MGWSIGYDPTYGRDIGYGVPAECDSPNCHEQIDRGLSYVCGSRPYGGEHGCGLYFCGAHRNHSRHYRGEDVYVEMCTRCYHYRPPYAAKPDTLEWVEFKLTDESWASWRNESPVEVGLMQRRLAHAMAKGD